MPAEKRSFAAPVEPVVYWDTSFALGFLFSTEPFHGQCKAFLERLEAAETLSLISDLVLNETAFVTIKRALVEEARRTGVGWLDVRKQRPDPTSAAATVAATKRGDLEDRALQIALPDTLTDRASQLVQDFALLPTDAYHIAAGLESGVNAFATLDRDFLDVDDIVVYTCLA